VAHTLRDPIDSNSWGVFRASVLGAASFGILPLLLWPRRFREYAAIEARQFRTVAEWSRRHGSVPAAVGPLRAAAEGLEARPILWLLPLLLAAFVVGAFVVRFNGTGWSWDDLLACTYRLNDYYPRFDAWMGDPWSNWPRQPVLHLIWCAGLSMAYLCHWVQVRLHRADVYGLVRRFNSLTRDQAIRAVRIRRFGSFNPLLIVAAVAFLHFDAWWGIPMLLAGAADRRYTISTSPAIRAQLAERVGEMQRGFAATARWIDRCGISRCQAMLPPQATFCPRCGTRVTA